MNFVKFLQDASKVGVGAVIGGIGVKLYERFTDFDKFDHSPAELDAMYRSKNRKQANNKKQND